MTRTPLIRIEPSQAIVGYKIICEERNWLNGLLALSHWKSLEHVEMNRPDVGSSGLLLQAAMPP